jgi:hypothetical protein
MSIRRWQDFPAQEVRIRSPKVKRYGTAEPISIAQRRFPVDRTQPTPYVSGAFERVAQLVEQLTFNQ